MFILLMIITLLAVVALVWVLIKYLREISETLMRIGGDGQSFLAKLRLGLRAIETETGAIPTEVTKLNQTLSDTGSGLKIVDQHLVGTIAAVLKQKI